MGQILIIQPNNLYINSIMNTIDFANSDIININNIDCNNIGSTGAIGSVLNVGIRANNDSCGIGYFDPWDNGVIKNGIDFSKFSEYLEWDDTGASIGGFTGGWVCIKPVLGIFNMNLYITATNQHDGYGYFRKYNSSLSIISSVDIEFSNRTSHTFYASSSYNKLEYLDVGDRVQMVYRNAGALAFRAAMSIYLIKDGTYINYTDE